MDDSFIKKLKSENPKTDWDKVKKKFLKLRKKKLEETLKCDSRTDHIKSAGNGL